MIAKNELVFEHVEEDFSSAHLEVTMAGSMAGAGSAIQPVTLFVCDIRGFSTITEKISSDHLAQQLGVWFREAGNLVAKSGDAILAYWSGCGDEGVDCEATLRIARELLELAAKINWSSGEPFRVGIAPHFGSAACGNVGVDAQRDATIIGDAVNTVFRLESVMKELNQQVLLSADFCQHLPTGETLVDFGERKLKGKQQAVRIYGLG